MLLGYFSTGWPAAIALLFAHVLALVALIHLLSGNQLAEDSSPPLSRGAGGDSPGPWLSLGLVFFLVLNFLNAFAFTYPYTLPFLRGSGWLFYLIGGLVLGVSMLRKESWKLSKGTIGHAPVSTFLTGLVLLGITVASVWPASVAEQLSGDTLRVATYNIHYGYDEIWGFNIEKIARTIEADSVDIIALQEVDAGRLTSFAVDDAYYLARRLKMNALYLPTVEHLTGIALLYKGSAQIRDARLLTSLQEQTGITHVHLDSAISPVHAYGIWIGLSAEDTLRQIREALDFIGHSSPAVFGGDFNSDPESAVVAEIRQAGFVDPFIELAIRPAPPTAPADRPTERIDYVWVRGLMPVRAWVSPSLASDHRMVVVELLTAPALVTAQPVFELDADKRAGPRVNTKNW
jgi:endonuclease/exonuclease/phosphatase family metal-dependent hydrolase